MKTLARLPFLAALALVVAAGCSALPGLRVLTNQEAAPDSQVLQLTELIMADKSGTTDPSLLVAADRIEAASGEVDIIEIRRDTAADVFTVYLMLNPLNPPASQEAFVNTIRRTMELTWQGMLDESQGSDVLKVVVLDLGAVPTLDKGLGFVGYVSIDAQIARSDVLTYLSQRPHTINDFVDLIAQGTLAIEQPGQESMQFYDGQPNHPVFMLAALEAQATGQQ